MFIFRPRRTRAAPPGFWRPKFGDRRRLRGDGFLALVPYQVFQTYARGVYAAGLVVLVATLVFGTPAGLPALGSIWAPCISSRWRWCGCSWRPRWRPTPTGATAKSASGRALFPLLALAGYFGLILLQPDLSRRAHHGAHDAGGAVLPAGAPLGFLVAIVAGAAIALGIPLTGDVFLHRRRTLGRQRDHDLDRHGVFKDAADASPLVRHRGGGGRAVVAAAETALSRHGFHLFAVLLVLIAGVGGPSWWTARSSPYQRKRLIAFVDPAVDPWARATTFCSPEIALGSDRFVSEVGHSISVCSVVLFLPSFLPFHSIPHSNPPPIFLVHSLVSSFTASFCCPSIAEQYLL